MKKSEHPGLAEFLDHLGGKTVAAVREHLGSGCAACASTLSLATRLREAAATELAEPPAASLSRARRLFAAQRRKGLAGRVREFVATLMPSPEPAFAGVRGAAAEPRVFEAGPWLVQVTVEPTGDRGAVVHVRAVVRETGEPAVGLLRYKGPGVAARESALTDLGESELEGLPVRGGEITLLLDGDRITIGL